jgi:cytochrome c-type biogenesis protein CcmH
MLADQPESLAQLRSLINEARQQLAQAGEAPTTEAPSAGPAPAAPAPAPAQKATGGAALSVKVSLDPALRERLAPGDTVFVYARAVEGPPMPLAVVRRPATELPFTVTLDDSMAMVPAMSLSRFDSVRVSARVSHSGNAMPQSGDLRGEVSPVKVASSSVIEIVINEIVQ